MYKSELLKEAFDEMREAVAHRRALHTMAEVGFSLPETTSYVTNYLQKSGLSPRVYDNFGVSVDIGCKDASAPTVLLRADTDALPLREESGLPFAAENGNAHACGHDMHAAMLLAALPLILRRRRRLSHRVRLVWQGAEEILGGARRMLADGVGEGVRAAYMLHTVTALPYPTGTLLLPPTGRAAPAASFFRLAIRASGGHVGFGTKKADALRVAAVTATVLSSLSAPARLSLGALRAGHAANVLPSEATIEGTVRSLEERAIEETLRKVVSTADGVATAYGGAVEMTVTASCPALVIDSSLREGASSTLKRVVGETGVLLTDSPSGASEDFAFFSERCPALTLALSAGSEEEGYRFPLHHPCVRFNEDALPYGAAAYAALALSDL